MSGYSCVPCQLVRDRNWPEQIWAADWGQEKQPRRREMRYVFALILKRFLVKDGNQTKV